MKQSKSIRFSVILPTRNRLDKLQRAIASVEQQTLRSFELLVVDDGSTDGTGEFLERLQPEAGPASAPRLVIIRNREGKGAGMARNQALEQSRGEFIAFLDDDDIWLPEYLEQQLRRFRENPQAAACTAAHVEFDVQGVEHEPDLLPLMQHDAPLLHLVTESFVHSMSVLAARRSAFEEIGLLDTSLAVCHDWDWCIRLVASGQSLLPPEGPVTVRREIPGGLVTRLADWYAEEQQILDRLFDEHPEYRRGRATAMAWRNLWFARVALSRGERSFAINRLAQAFGRHPLSALRIIRLKLARQRNED
jgi:glycosyltransferase involved in cell wall biosynthesis